jgi:hypothetical protein
MAARQTDTADRMLQGSPWQPRPGRAARYVPVCRPGSTSTTRMSVSRSRKVCRILPEPSTTMLDTPYVYLCVIRKGSRRISTLQAEACATFHARG